MAKDVQPTRQIGIIAAGVGVLSLLFLPVISLLGSTTGGEIIGAAFKSKDSEDLLIGFILVSIAALGVVAIVLYGLNQLKEAASASIVGLIVYVVGIIFLMVKFQSAEAIEILGSGAWISIIGYVVAALAPLIFGTASIPTKSEKESSEDRRYSADPRLQAREEMAKVKLQDKPLDVDLLMEHAQSLRELGKNAEAAKQAEKALSVDGQNRDAFVFLAEVYHALGSIERAKEMLELVTKTPKSSPKDFLQLADLYEMYEDTGSTVMRVIEEGLTKFPEDPNLLAAFVLLQIKTGRVREALSLATEKLDLPAINPDVLEPLLDAAIESRKFEETYKIAEVLSQKAKENQSAALFSAAGTLLRHLNQNQIIEVENDVRELSRLDVSGFTEIETRHYYFLIGIAHIALEEYSEEDFQNIFEGLTRDPEICFIWKNAVGTALSKISPEPNQLTNPRAVLNQIVTLSRLFQSAEIREQAAGLSAGIAAQYEARKDWKLAEELYRLSLNLTENDENREAMKRVAAHDETRRKRLIFVVVGCFILAMSLAGLYYFAHGRIEIIVRPAAAVQVLKGEKVVFESLPHGEDSVTHVLTPFLLFGDCTIKAESPGYIAKPMSVSIGFGRKTTDCFFTLTQLFGNLRVDSYPKKAKIYIDDRYAGLTPATLDSLLAKSTTLSLRYEGFDNYEEQIDIIHDSLVNLGNIKLNFVTDFDGNVYRAVKIDNQWWMAENLKVTHYRNGDSIPNVTSAGAWANFSTGAYCNYENDKSHVATYGRLYNWYAVNDSRNIAPKGWHVPCDAEWQTLVDYLGGPAIAGGKLKEVGTMHWDSPNTGASNESGFTALPGGVRYDGAGFGHLGYYAYFWSSTEYSPFGRDLFAYSRRLECRESEIARLGIQSKPNGSSVRCIMD